VRTENVKNYGLVLTEIVTDASTVPVLPATNVNNDHPQIRKKSGRFSTAPPART
jgi:hypothetical protein